MDFLLALVIISPALLFLWLALVRYHARTDQEEKQEEQVYIPPTLPKIIPREPEKSVEPAVVETKPESKIEEAPKSKTTKRASNSKAEKSPTKPKQPKIKRTK